jgi:hypothetical protein
MSNYPPGCSQATHDRAFDELGPVPHEPEVVRLDCGHYDTEENGEQAGGKLVCSRCFDARQKEMQSATSPEKRGVA